MDTCLYGAYPYISAMLCIFGTLPPPSVGKPTPKEPFTYRCGRILGFLGKDTFDLFPQLWGTQAEYGAVKHFKSVCDGKFGEMKAMRNTITSTTTLNTIADLTGAYTDFHARQRVLDPSVVHTEFVEWMPPMKSAVKATLFATHSVFAPIQSCHSWSMKREDARRTNLMGRGANASVVTGIKMRAHMLSGVPAIADRTGHAMIEIGDPVEPDMEE
jgi:hypothetical protein